MNPRSIQVGIVDDHKAVLQAFKYVIEQDEEIQIVLEAESGQDLLRHLKECAPEVLLLDIRMPDINGIEILSILYEKYPSVKVVMLTAFVDETYISQCLKFGIYAYLSKMMDIGNIILAIKSAHANEPFFGNLLADHLLRRYLHKFHNNVDEALPDFTSREIQILDMTKEEKTTEEISNALNLSKRSIEIKREHMKMKANAKTRGFASLRP